MKGSMHGDGGFITRNKAGDSPVKISDPGPGKGADPVGSSVSVTKATPTDARHRHLDSAGMAPVQSKPSRLDGMTQPAGKAGSIKKLGGSRDRSGFKFRY